MGLCASSDQGSQHACRERGGGGGASACKPSWKCEPDFEALDVGKGSGLSISSLAIDGDGEGGSSQLHQAAAAGETDAIRRLAAALGARLDARDARGRTALAVAAASGQDLAVRLLLALGASPTAADSGGRLPLHQLAHAPGDGAARAAHAAVALLQGGAPIDAADAAGQTALHVLAGQRGSDAAAACIKLLLRAGADAFVIDCSEQTALGCALAAGNQRAVELLLLCKRPGEEPAWAAVSPAGWTWGVVVPARVRRHATGRSPLIPPSLCPCRRAQPPPGPLAVHHAQRPARRAALGGAVQHAVAADAGGAGVAAQAVA